MARKLIVSIAAISAAVLIMESTLLRLLSVAQFYHFAFLVVSLALLGFGASGSALALLPRLRQRALESLLAISSAGYVASLLLAYGIINILPFDSYSIAWDSRQVFLFFLYFFVLTVPFFFGGLAVGAGLGGIAGSGHLVYAANLAGAALGVFLAPLLMRLAGVPGAVLGTFMIGLLPAILHGLGNRPGRVLSGGFMLLSGGILAFMAGQNLSGKSPFGMTYSPYKSLAYAQQIPQAHSLFGAWSEISRIDVLANAGVRRLPGLSYTYQGDVPEQLGLYRDADSVQPVNLLDPSDFKPASSMPEAFAFSMYPGGQVLVVSSGGGFGVHQALASGVGRVTAVLEDVTILRALEASAPAYDIYTHPQVDLVLETPRSYLSRSQSDFDIVFLPLTDPYRPVTSGSYSLGEEYRLTVEAFQGMLGALGPQGTLVTTRWLQTPPSESLRLAATLIEAMEGSGIDPVESLVMYRGIQTATFIVRPTGWNPYELQALHQFLDGNKFDLVWAPGLSGKDVNHYNRLPEPVYYLSVKELLGSPDRDAVYASHEFDIRPPRDNHPFFFHYFKAEQTSQVLAEFGKKWLPFGGSGYFVLFAMLGFVTVLSALLIAAPLFLIRRRIPAAGPQSHFWPVFLYFSVLGIAFLFIEIPLIQGWILLLGHPVYAFTFVVGILLGFSGLGSASVRQGWFRPKLFLGILALLTIGVLISLPTFYAAALSWPLPLKLAAGLVFLAPLGFFMGMPFPAGVMWMEVHAPWEIYWAWAINGCVSVVASVLAAILALHSGFSLVLGLGAGAYALGWLVYTREFRWEAISTG